MCPVEGSVSRSLRIGLVWERWKSSGQWLICKTVYNEQLCRRQEDKAPLFCAKGYRLETVNIMQDLAGDLMAHRMASKGRTCQNMGNPTPRSLSGIHNLSTKIETLKKKTKLESCKAFSLILRAPEPAQTPEHSVLTDSCGRATHQEYSLTI